MNQRHNDFLLAQRPRRGQALILVTLSLPVFMGLAGLVFDLGRIYAAQSALNASSQAAALAGGEAMAQPGATTTTVTTAVTAYSSVAGNNNASPLLSGASLVSGYPTLPCLTTVETLFSIACYGPSSSNAIVVKQQVTVLTVFLRLLGAKSVTLTATATASMKGSTAGPYNIALIVNSTHSMTSDDSDSYCKNTRLYCAMGGVQVLLNTLSPCLASESSCGTVTKGMVANSVDRVALYTFPPVTALTAVDDYNCGKTAPTTVGYTIPFPGTSTYQIVGFSSDYRTSDTASSLYTSSNIVAAAGGNGGTPCIQAVGGFGTYYAQAITLAQADLVTEQGKFPNSQNVIIMLSDGDATASCTTFVGGVCTAGDMVGASKTSGTYTSTVQECNQAVTAAATAAKAGTRIYSVAYGAEAAGCTTDTAPSITPCQTMQQIASAPAYFFSDYNATGGTTTCVSASQPVTNLNQIFQVIGADLTVAKLLPNGTT